MERLLIIGAGGHGRAVAEAVTLGRDFQLVAFLDDGLNRPQSIGDVPVWGSTGELEACLGRVDAVFVAIGRNDLRQTLHARVSAVGHALAQVVHPRAIVSPSALLGPGCAVMAGAIVGTQAFLGEGVIVNCGAIVDHDCRVERFGHLGVGVSLAGGAVMGEGAWMQAGSALGYGVHVRAGQVVQPGEGIAAC